MSFNISGVETDVPGATKVQATKAIHLHKDSSRTGKKEEDIANIS